MPKLLYKRTLIVVAILLACVAALVYSTSVKKPASITKYDATLPAEIDYNLHVKPILSDKCFLCHGPDKNNGQKAGLNLSDPTTAMALLKSGNHAIVPGSLGRSELYQRISSTDDDLVMPTKASNRVLTDYEKAILTRWIEQGAKYKPHWAFIPPVKNKLPEVANKHWPVNSIDYFVLHRLEENKLTPAPEADKQTLLRRVTLDLTGLPPTLEETKAFLADASPNAYERVVDRLLQTPQFAEKMTVDWLDLSRYADTHGYTVDRYRDMSPWRDWVIKSFNQNMPFNQFVTWQLAGDLLPGATREQKLATAFNRNHAQNMEGGIINEEFRNEYVIDRTSTLGTAFLGLTIGCARCHDHKFDPVSQKDFYSLYSFFNNVDEAGQISFDNATPGPSMLLRTHQQDSVLVYLQQQEKQTTTQQASIAANEKPAFEKWKQQLGNRTPFNLTKDLQAHYDFDRLVNGAFINATNASIKGTVADPVLVPGIKGNAFKSNGDDILKLGNVGVFGRFQPFSIGIWVNIPKDVDKGVIFHKGNGDITYAFHGYYLNLRDGKAEFLMAHTWPYNELLMRSEQPLPKEKWIQLTLTSNGSGKTSGIHLFLDGKELGMIAEKDNLYKDILVEGKNPPALQIGADWRGTGFKGGLVDELYVYSRALNPAEIPMLVALTKPGSVPAPSDQQLQQYYLENISTAWQEQQKQLQDLRLQKNKLEEPIPEIMVMEEMKQKRKAHILLRGVYDSPGEAVQPDAPAAILPFPTSLRRDRLGLAQWLFDAGNPLTARVTVNRYWQSYFGEGIQKNADNFGNQGGVPSDIALLDWLAIYFRDSGWNIKAMQKLIVMSATYRQSSTANAATTTADPGNTLHSRGPAFRLSAEMLRDGVLKASGLLYDTIGGPSVKPYQPEGLWAVNSATYTADTGKNLYRRSLYTFWRRTNPPPSMSTFDAPYRASCIVKRQKTSTPLQALVLLNDPQYIEASRVLFLHATQQTSNLTDQILYSYRSLTGRTPADREIKVLEKLYQAQYQKFKTDPSKMKGWLTAGASKIKSDTDKTTLAAGTVMVSTIINSDAYVTKR